MGFINIVNLDTDNKNKKFKKIFSKYLINYRLKFKKKSMLKLYTLTTER